ncbi:hypothetical protein PYCCODRAFT_1441640 [Trametes coccinea BRFM310]|uniref:Uncharacterized protein n=1 Tax=Trametes coccinea (strain BRFM310) TaxID=1353009 RepID=A0A1Y2J2U8_TRAC3|nr:hypothetical protein PYCCODRAFT_1441640 [Trametes coccinea BRFM310]
MALVCHHDIVLSLANVNTPSKQQKFTTALLEHFFSLIPDCATVAVLYDIGCVVDHSVRTFDILPASVLEHLIFAMSVMHAYGHQWACQIVYNPRLWEGLGLTEGEGTERVWSQFRMLIGVTQTSGFINEATQEALRAWICSKLMEARDATDIVQLKACGVAIEELRKQWDLQQSAQLSVRCCLSLTGRDQLYLNARAWVKRELDAVVSLQGELDSIEQHFTTVQESIKSRSTNPISQDFLQSPRCLHVDTIKKVEGLYTSLNVMEGFPELGGLPVEFVCTLFIAHDLKINFQRRAIGSFFESSTKLHQQTRKAIAKWTPALMTAIRKFNSYCDDLQAMYKPDLLTDVWVTHTGTDTPRWLQDPNVPHGIHAMLARDHCLEEWHRLGNEADNLCWFLLA